MKRYLLNQWSGFFCGLIVSAAVTHAQSGITYQNPVIAGNFPDPSVIRAGNEFWATATSAEWSPQFPIMRSIDLVNWHAAGSVFEFAPLWASGEFRAPALVAHNRLYYAYYSARKKGGPLSVGVGVAFKPEGPYKDHGPLVSQAAGSVDPMMVKDEKGDPYLVWKENKQPGVIWARRLDDNGIQFNGEPKELLRGDSPWEGGTIEGPFIVQRGDYFYMIYSGNACSGADCKSALGIARARELLGPWEKNPGNPFLVGNADWKCPGQASVVLDDEKRFWLLYSAYRASASIFTGREALLDEMKFTPAGWVEINIGMGPTAAGESPLARPQRAEESVFVDAFTAGKLKAGWNWPVGDEIPAAFSNGRLILKAPSARGQDLMGGVIGRLITTGQFAATATLSKSRLEPGVIAGLAALGDRENSTGIAFVDERVIVWNRIAGQQKVIAEAAAPKSNQVIFRLIAAGGKRYQFAFSGDGKTWTDVAEATGDHLPGENRGVRVGLTVGGARNAEARFDSFEMQTLEPQ